MHLLLICYYHKLDYYQQLSQLKKKNKNLKVLLSIGSFRDGTTPFVKIFNNNNKRRDFVRNVVNYLKGSNFDGLEINWSIRNIDQFLYSNQSDFVTFMMMKFIQVTIKTHKSYIVLIYF
jgi:chitinase